MDRHQKNKETFQQLWAHFWVGAGNFVFLCLCRFGVSSGLVFFVFFGACQCFVKSKLPNLQRHQKTQNKQSGSGGHIDRHQKQKTNFPATMGPLLDRCWEIWIWFFCACAGLVFLVVWCFFFCCLPMFCEVRVTKPAQTPKKTKWKWSKHRQAPKKHTQRKTNFPATMGPLLGSCWIFCFFVPVQVWCF